MGVAARWTEHVAVTLEKFQGEREDSTGPQRLGDGGEDGGEVAKIDQHVGGDGQIKTGRAGLQDLQNVVDEQLIVKVALACFFNHSWRKIDTDEAAAVGFEQRRAQAGAAAEIDDVGALGGRVGNGGGAAERFVDQFGPAVLERFDEVAIEAFGESIKEAADMLGRRDRRDIHAGDGGDVILNQRRIRAALERFMEHEQCAVFVLSSFERHREILIGFGTFRMQRDSAAIARHSFAEFALFFHGFAEVAVGEGVFWIDANGLAVRCGGGIDVALIAEGIAEAVVGDGVVRAKANDLAEAFDCGIDFAEFMQDNAEISECFDIIGLQRQGLPIGGEGFVAAAQSFQCVAEVIECLRMCRLKGEHVLVRGECVIEAALLLQDHAEIVVSIDVVWIDGGGAAAEGFGFVEAVEAAIDFGELGVDGGILRGICGGLAEQEGGGVVAFDLKGEQAQPMQGVDLVGIVGEDLLVEEFGFLKAAGLVVLHGALEAWGVGGGSGLGH